MLRIDQLTAGYGAMTILRDVSISVDAGEVVAVLGPNGAGKTTLLRCLSGLVKAETGTIELDGKDITRARPATRVVTGIAHVPEGRLVFPSLTVKENLAMGAYRRRSGVGELIAQQYKRFPRLAERENQQAGYLSGGEQQMLAIARGLMSEPRLIALDEPSLGLAPVIVETLMEAVVGLRGESRAVLLVEQNPLVALHVADRVYVMRQGTLTDLGSVAELRRTGRWKTLLRLEEDS